jgi:hypothetical protein
MANVTDEQRRALRLLARQPDGCAEAMLLDQGFTVWQLCELVLRRLANIRAADRGTMFLIRITEAGRKAIADFGRRGRSADLRGKISPQIGHGSKGLPTSLEPQPRGSVGLVPRNQGQLPGGFADLGGL